MSSKDSKSKVSNFLDSMECFSLDNTWSVSLMQTTHYSVVVCTDGTGCKILMAQQSFSISSACCFWETKSHSSNRPCRISGGTLGFHHWFCQSAFGVRPTSPWPEPSCSHVWEHFVNSVLARPWKNPGPSARWHHSDGWIHLRSTIDIPVTIVRAYWWWKSSKVKCKAPIKGQGISGW